MAGYGTDGAFAAWLTANGLTLPGTAAAPAILRQRGSAYIDGLYGLRFSGIPTGGYAQERAWPRTGATAYRATIPDNEIPVAIEHASYFAAYQEALQPGSLTITGSASGAVKRERIDVIETEYFAGSGDVIVDGILRMASVEGLLAPFLIPVNTGLCIGLWAVG